MRQPGRPRIVESLARADTPERWSQPASVRERAADLGRALSQDRLVLRYQPIVDLRSGECHRVEALLRWPVRGGSVPPSEIIAIAESGGLIARLSRWVVGEAVRQLVAWREKGLILGVAVNVAGPELADADAIGEVIAILRAAAVDPGTFTFDVSARALLSVANIRGALRQLGAAGVRFALDGVAPSDVPGRTFARGIDELKLSRSLVRRLAGDPGAMHDARALVEFAHDLRLLAVAVGVEDLATRVLVEQLGCELAQGHWLSRPLAARRIAAWQRVAIGLAFSGAFAVAAQGGAAKAAGSSRGNVPVPTETQGFLPTFCCIDLPGAHPDRLTAAAALSLLRERTGNEFVAQHDGPLDVFIEASVRPDGQARIARAVQGDVSRVESDYGRTFTTAPTVYVFATRASFALGLQQLFGARPADAGLLAAANGGVTLPKQAAIVINLQNVPQDDDFEILRHELTHAMVHEIIGPDASLPAWVDEGLATLEEHGQRSDEVELRDGAVTMQLLVSRQASLQDLDSPVQWAQRNALLNGQGYTVAGQAMRLLRTQVSQQGLLRMFEDTRSGGSFSAAYAVVSGESLADFERAFSARLATDLGGPRVTAQVVDDGVRWAVAGFAPGRRVEISIRGKGYAVDYSATTDRYGMYAAAFGTTAPPGDYAVTVKGLDGTATGSMHVGKA